MGLGVLVCAAAGAGCVVEDTEVHPVWPAPPAVARIIHLKNIRTGSDLVQASGLDAVIRALTGGQEFGLLRPHVRSLQGERRQGLVRSSRRMPGVWRLPQRSPSTGALLPGWGSSPPRGT